MEDQESEWEIQEYSSSKAVANETSMLKWILNKGYGIGKKMVITGIAISSAPLVLPPLVVFSAMGVGFSVPFGLVFASYACTNKLMSMLLPTPPPPPPLMLEYYTDEYEQEKDEGIDHEHMFELDNGGDDYRQINAVEKDYYNDEYDDDYVQEVEQLVTKVDGDVDEKGYYSDEEQNEEDDDERMKDVKQEDDIVLEFDDRGDDYRQHGDVLITNVDENKDEKSYYNNENEDEKEMEDNRLRKENVIEEEEREQMDDIKQDDQGYEGDVGEYLEGQDGNLEEKRKRGEEPLVEIQIVENKSNIREVTEDENDEIVKGSTGLLEKIRDEGRVDNTVEDENILGESDSNVVFEEVKDVETKEPVIVKEIDSQKLIENGNNDETIGEIRHVVVLAEGIEENNFNAREIQELDLVEREVRGDTGKHRRNYIESDEKVMRESRGTQETTGGNIFNDGSEDVILGTKKEYLVHSNADAREIGDESGLDLFDERNTNINFENLEVEKNVADENVDVLALPAFRRAPLDTDNAKLTPTTKAKKPSGEDILDDEKIWKKIGAMRRIVGYNAPSQPTFISELKALYVFTGVEPPVSFKSDSDLDEVKAKLKFLMSIVGVK